MTLPLTARQIADQLVANQGDDADPMLLDRLLADDVTWELKGHGLDYARLYRGKAEIYGQYMGKLQQRIDPAATTITQIATLVDEAQSAIIVHNTDALALVGGGRIDVDVVMIMRVVDGFIVSVIEFMDLRPVEAAFGTSLDA